MRRLHGKTPQPPGETTQPGSSTEERPSGLTMPWSAAAAAWGIAAGVPHPATRVIVVGKAAIHAEFIRNPRVNRHYGERLVENRFRKVCAEEMPTLALKLDRCLCNAGWMESESVNGGPQNRQELK
jgi:hypothetical protein